MAYDLLKRHKSGERLSGKMTARKRYTVTCACGHKMRVRRRHVGRMCRCKKCAYPIYVTFENIQPPLDPIDRLGMRCFDEKDIPVNWQSGDLLMGIYEVRKELGNGGMGKVYRVYHREWSLDLAVKCPLAHMIQNASSLANFLKECETWINLHAHPNTVTCFYVRQMGGIPRVFVEYVDGHNLREQILSRRLYAGGEAKALARILDIGIQFAWGLEHAHQEGMIHQDVKPSNVLVARNGTVKVTDFGVSQVLHRMLAEENEPVSYHNTGGVGTPVYRSPDYSTQARITQKTDMWGWAVSMLEVLCGTLYWEHGAQAPEVLEQLLAGDVPGMLSKIPDPVAELLQDCFEIDPKNRPDDMGCVGSRLVQAYAGITGEPYPRKKPARHILTSDILNNRAISMRDLGKSDEAEALWNQVCEQDPDHFIAKMNLRLHDWRTGRTSDKRYLSYLYELCSEFPEEWRPRVFLARSLMEMGASQAAIQVLEKLPEQAASKREAAFALAMAQNRKSEDKELLGDTHAHSSAITALTIHSDNVMILTGCVQGKVRIWDKVKRKCIGRLEGHEGRVNHLALSEDKKTILTAGDDHTLRVWNARTCTCLHTLKAHRDHVLSVAMSHDGKLALSGGADGQVRLWHVHLAHCNMELSAHEDAVSAVAMAEREKTFLSASLDQTVRIWDAQKGTLLKMISGFNQPVQDLALCSLPERATVAAGNKLYLVDLEAGQITKELLGHQTDIETVSMSRDGRLAVSATREGTLKLWRLPSGQCLRTFQGCAPCRLSKDGRLLLAQSDPEYLRIWDIHSDKTPFKAPFLLCHDKPLEDLSDCRSDADE